VGLTARYRDSRGRLTFPVAGGGVGSMQAEVVAASAGADRAGGAGGGAVAVLVQVPARPRPLYGGVFIKQRAGLTIREPGKASIRAHVAWTDNLAGTRLTVGHENRPAGTAFQ
jgi:hypothetical protein